MSSSAVSADDLAARVMEVTGSSRQVALELLAACANDVQSAVDLFLANDDNEPDVEVDVESVGDCRDADGVRAPIAPVREQLIGPEDDNFRPVAHATGPAAKSRSLPRIKVCPLRDFAREGSIMEETLANSEQILVPIVHERHSRPSSSRSTRTSTAISSSSSTSSVAANRLGDLFRPPTDISIAGTFLFARTRATGLKRWLLVNVQSDNFNSQLLNRDVWTQLKIRSLIKKHFLLWQVSSDTSEGSRFITFYHCSDTPYLCIIDPRTGEELWKSDDPIGIKVLDALHNFLTDHSSEEFFQCDLKATATSSSSLLPNSTTSEVRSSSSEILSDNRKRSRSNELSATELSEEEQIMLAVRNSLQENGCANNTTKKSRVSDDDEDTFHEISDSDDDVQSVPIQLGPSQNEPTKDEAAQQPVEPEKHIAYIGTCTNEITILKIRVVNADIDECVTIKWPSDTKLRALQLYIAEKYPSVKDKFKLISPFPRKVVDLTEDSGMQTLKEANLHPSSTLHVHLDD